MAAQIVMDFTKKVKILIFPYSINILRCKVFENTYKLQVGAFVQHTLFGQNARPRARARPQKEEVGEPVAGVAAGPEKQYTDAVLHWRGPTKNWGDCGDRDKRERKACLTMTE